MVDKATLLADLTPEETAWYNTIAPLQRRKLLRVVGGSWRAHSTH